MLPYRGKGCTSSEKASIQDEDEVAQDAHLGERHVALPYGSMRDLPQGRSSSKYGL